MGDIINLRRHRKAVARDEAAKAAHNARAAHGRTKAEKLQAKADNARAARVVDGAKLTPEAKPGEAKPGEEG
jgi:hypothetical protein